MHRWRLLPGLSICSNFRWTIGAVVGAALLVALDIYIVGHARPAERRALFSRAEQPPAGAPHPRRRTYTPSPSSIRRQRPFIPTKQRRRRLTRKQKSELLAHFQHRCAWCRCALHDKPWLVQFDHLIPLAADRQGVHTERLNAPNGGNWQPLCVACHARKTWEERRAGLYSRRNHAS